MSILPPNPVDFWLKRWFGGVMCPALLAGYGVYALVTNHSYAIGFWRYGTRLHFAEVTGFKATLMAIAFMGFALSLFSYCYAPYSKLYKFSEYGEVTGLVIAVVGVAWCSWLLLIGA